MQSQPQAKAWDREAATVDMWLAEARRYGREDVYAGKRQHVRVTWEAPVTVVVYDGRQAGETDHATTRDISSGGLGLRCRRPLAVHSLVAVVSEIDGQCVHATVMHCTETLGGFLVGVEFLPRTPAHLELRRSA